MRFPSAHPNLQAAGMNYPRNSVVNATGVSATPIPPKLVVGAQVGISSNSSSRGSSLSPLVSGATNRVLIGGATGSAFSGKSPQYNPRNPLAGLYSPKANHPATRLLQFQNTKAANSIQTMQNSGESEQTSATTGTYMNVGEGIQKAEYRGIAFDVLNDSPVTSTGKNTTRAIRIL